VLAIAARAALAGIAVVGPVDVETRLAQLLMNAAHRHRLFVIVPDGTHGGGVA
jgi:hypothetical protein